MLGMVLLSGYVASAAPVSEEFIQPFTQSGGDVTVAVGVEDSWCSERVVDDSDARCGGTADGVVVLGEDVIVVVGGGVVVGKEVVVVTREVVEMEGEVVVAAVEDGDGVVTLLEEGAGVALVVAVDAMCVVFVVMKGIEAALDAS